MDQETGAANRQLRRTTLPPDIRSTKTASTTTTTTTRLDTTKAPPMETSTFLPISGTTQQPDATAITAEEVTTASPNDCPSSSDIWTKAGITVGLSTFAITLVLISMLVLLLYLLVFRQKVKCCRRKLSDDGERPTTTNNNTKPSEARGAPFTLAPSTFSASMAPTGSSYQASPRNFQKAPTMTPQNQRIAATANSHKQQPATIVRAPDMMLLSGQFADSQASNNSPPKLAARNTTETQQTVASNAVQKPEKSSSRSNKNKNPNFVVDRNTNKLLVVNGNADVVPGKAINIPFKF